MRNHKARKLVRIVSLVLVVAVMMSVCLVQAFAASVSTTYNGYRATAYVSMTNRRVFAEGTYDIPAILEINLSGDYIHSATGEMIDIDVTASAYHYQVTALAENPPTAYTHYTAQAVFKINDNRVGVATNSYRG